MIVFIVPRRLWFRVYVLTVITLTLALAILERVSP